ncbi:uncharacterized protein LOC126383494 isoform X4 [Epinephelus moara]|uniref:uncharacterized protein LOC126383494 isoform X4 n=1 Tax=Epinephelus moara TaxID=300413 RepID=UPI00214E3108|nr:uncharacterized protein LOC126383494 isoform X4 [Epinephelus moara]
MSKIEMLRLLINQRLTEAAEEIFGVFGRTIAEYEEEISRSKLEIDRQRRLLELSRKPQVSLQANSTAAVCEQQDWSASLDLNEMKPASIKEEEEELWPEETPQMADQNDVKFVLFQSGGVRNKQGDDQMTSSLSKLQDLGDSELDPQPGTSVQPTSSDLDDDAPEAADPASGNGDCVDLDASLSESLREKLQFCCDSQAGHEKMEQPEGEIQGV